MLEEVPGDSESVSEVPKAGCGGDCLLAHHLNNQLAVIMGRLELLSEALSDDTHIVEQISVIQEAARRMARHIQEHQCRLIARIPKRNYDQV